MQIKTISSKILKISFNKNDENLCIADIIKAFNNDNYGVIGQVFKIENNDGSENIASVEILYTLQDNQWKKWQGNVPFADFEVDKIDSDEIYKNLNSENFGINLGQLSSYPDIDLDFEIAKLQNLTAIFCDEFPKTHFISKQLSENFAQNGIKTLVLDFSKTYINIDNAKILTAGKDFKLPLNVKNIQNIYGEISSDLSIPAKAFIQSIFIGIIQFVENSKTGLISYSSFRNFVEKNIGQNTSAEVILIRNRIENIEKMGVFADNSNEIKSLELSIEENNLTVIDFSNISVFAQKVFAKYLINANLSDCLLFTDLSNEVFDDNLVDNLCIKTAQNLINPIVSLSYNSKFADKIMLCSQNFVLSTPKGKSDIFEKYKYHFSMLDFSEILLIGAITKQMPLIVNLIPSKTEEISFADYHMEEQAIEEPVITPNIEPEIEEEITLEQEIQILSEEPVLQEDFEPEEEFISENIEETIEPEVESVVIEEEIEESQIESQELEIQEEIETQEEIEQELEMPTSFEKIEENHVEPEKVEIDEEIESNEEIEQETEVSDEDVIEYEEEEEFDFSAFQNQPLPQQKPQYNAPIEDKSDYTVNNQITKDVEKLFTTAPKQEEVPIYHPSDEVEQEKTYNFQEGDSVKHQKYSFMNLSSLFY
ncbi:MAG: hypothetical protein PHV68_07730 [Candidatus Gastranaerophilales bacterium]|nr:hypothetical protein [Candidatus Gastranaerophilales bacterium]